MIGTIVYYFTAISSVLGIFGIGYAIADMLCDRYIAKNRTAEVFHPEEDGVALYESLQPNRHKVKHVKKKVIQEKVVVVKTKTVKPQKTPKPQKVKKVKPKKVPKSKRQTGEKEHSLPYYLFGIGALTVAGHALLAHHVKNKDTSEERRKD